MPKKPIYLLDTNIISSLVRDPHGKVYEQLCQVGEGVVCTSIVVAAELRFGIKKRNLDSLTQRVEAILSTLAILPFTEPADYAYAKLRTQLEQTGQVIGGNDMLIAAHALSMGLILITDNTREFERVTGLLVENWLR